MAPALPLLAEMVADDPWWRYPSRCAAGDGIAHLRVWQLEGRDGHLAVVTETGLGASITNSAAEICAELARIYPGPLTVIEHWPAGEAYPVDDEHLDLVCVHDGSPQWQRIWPTPPANPDHDALTAWMRACGHVITDSQPG
jgi:hypothetical protein